MNTGELNTLVCIDTSQFDCTNVSECAYQERTLSYAIKIKIPEEVVIDQQEVFKDCCYEHFVLADTTDSSDYKNDYSSFYHQRQASNETVEYVLVNLADNSETPVDATIGIVYNFGDFPTNTNLNGCIIEWRKVLQIIGEGAFQIVKRQNLLGVDYETKSYVFNLKTFTTSRANHTVKIETVRNGTNEREGISFKGTNWRQSIRVPGFFGRREAQYEEDTITTRFFEKKQISIKQTNEYSFQTNLIPDCISNEILDFAVMANDIYMTDYNLNNHSYNFIKFGVKIESNPGSEYGNRTRKVRLNLTFTDKFDNRIKRNFK